MEFFIRGDKAALYHIHGFSILLMVRTLLTSPSDTIHPSLNEYWVEREVDCHCVY